MADMLEVTTNDFTVPAFLPGQFRLSKDGEALVKHVEITAKNSLKLNFGCLKSKNLVHYATFTFQYSGVLNLQTSSQKTIPQTQKSKS